MNVWEVIFAAVLSNAAVLAVLGLLAKALLDKLIARDSKRFEIELAGKANEAIEKIKSELQVQASQTVEKFKSDLQLQAMEHQVRFSRLHEKQAEVIADLNALVVEALLGSRIFSSRVRVGG